MVVESIFFAIAILPIHRLPAPLRFDPVGKQPDFIPLQAKDNTSSSPPLSLRSAASRASGSGNEIKVPSHVVREEPGARVGLGSAAAHGVHVVRVGVPPEKVGLVKRNRRQALTTKKGEWLGV